MAIGEVHHVALSVSDLARSLAFYREVLGFKPALEIEVGDPAQMGRMLQMPAPRRARSVILRKAHSTVGELELIEFDPPAARLSGPREPGDPGVFLISFEVTGEDLDAIHARLQARGVPCHGPPEDVELAGYGRIRSLVFRDPDGVMLELVTLPPADQVRRSRASASSRS
jgi:catechol 2,3-dioxygenase-like lactoylglutathione lyase family enzyme